MDFTGSNGFDCFEENLLVPFSLSFEKINNFLSSQFPNHQILRFTSSSFNKDYFKAHVLLANKVLMDSNIFDFKKRKHEDESNFNVCFLVPTGIGCEIGGHAGDATPSLNLISQSCDKVITHPNVVNASDINEMPNNALYVEGHHITDLIMGNISLGLVRSNNVLVLIDNNSARKKFVDLAINSVNGARATLGLNADIELLSSDFKMEGFFKENKAIGKISNFESIFHLIQEKIDSIDAIAISSPILTEPGTHEIYSRSNGEMVNPWGGVESMLTHTISSYFNKPSAHAPMFETQEIANLHLGVVDARIAPELVSNTFLHCVLKGLHKSPKILKGDGGLGVKDISALVIPDGVLGLPVLSALKQGIKVIAVKNKNTMNNDLSLLPWNDRQFFKCNSYLEASGILNCLRSGISIDSVKRPLNTLNTEIDEKIDLEETSQEANL